MSIKYLYNCNRSNQFLIFIGKSINIYLIMQEKSGKFYKIFHFFLNLYIFNAFCSIFSIKYVKEHIFSASKGAFFVSKQRI